MSVTPVPAPSTVIFPVHSPPVKFPLVAGNIPPAPDTESATVPANPATRSPSTVRAVIVTGNDCAAACAPMAANAKVATSLSCTTVFAVAFGKPPALAVSVTACAPSASVLSAIVIGNVALLCPAGMVTLEGTERRAGAEEESETVTGATTTPPIVTVPAVAAVPCPSVNDAGAATASVASSLSFTVITAVPPVQFGTDAVSVTLCGPSSRLLSTTVRFAVTLVCPAGKVTVAGTVAFAVLLLARVITVLFTGAALEVIVIALARVPLPSVALAGAAMLSVAVSLSKIVMDAVAGSWLTVDTVITATCVLSSSALSSIVTGNVTLVCPPGIVTVGGTEALAGTLDEMPTTVPAHVPKGTLTVAFTVAPPSVAVAGRMSASAPSDWTSNPALVPLWAAPSSASNFTCVAFWLMLMVPDHTPF